MIKPKTVDDEFIPAIEDATFRQATISSWIGLEKQLLSAMCKNPDAPKPDAFGRYKLRELATYLFNHFRFRNREKNKDVDEIKRDKLEIERDLKAAELERVRGDNMPVEEHNSIVSGIVQEQRRITEAAMRGLIPLVAGRNTADVARIVSEKITLLCNEFEHHGKEVNNAKKKNVARAKKD